MMNMKRKKQSLSYFLCIMLIVAMALFTNGCGGDKKTQDDSVKTETNTFSDAKVLGEGNVVFDFTVVDLEGTETVFEIHTDKTTVGEALLDAELIAGDQGDFGLYVKTVNGITLDYEKDGAYWSFYINDEYAMTGVDATNITEGDSYCFKAEKA